MNHTVYYPKMEISFGEKKPAGVNFLSTYEHRPDHPAVSSTEVHKLIAFAPVDDGGEIMGPVVPSIADTGMLYTPLFLKDLTVSFTP